MKKIIITFILASAFTTFAIQAVEQKAFSGAGIIESKTGGFMFPDGSVQTKAADDDLSARVAQLEATVAELQGLLFAVSRGIDPDTGQDTIVFEDVNVQIVNGTGSTDGTRNGTGNLIIGYNEIRNEANATEPCPSDWETEFFCNRRTGSHMLIIGRENNYTFYGGIVIGSGNETAGAHSSVSGGRFNIASGIFTSVSGGEYNIAGNWFGSVSGGRYNTASGPNSSVSGGISNSASADYSSVSGGRNNTASADYSSVSGGQTNTASGLYSSVSGGFTNEAGALRSVISGGVENNASGPGGASVHGGYQNTASGAKATVVGGHARTAASANCVVGDDGVDC